METPNAKMPGADSYPAWIFPAFIIAALPFFAFFLYNGEPIKAFLASLSVGSILTTSVTLWRYRNFFSLWIILGVDAVVHAMLVFYVSNVDTHFPGIIFTPLVVMDILIWQFIAVRAINLLRI